MKKMNKHMALVNAIKRGTKVMPNVGKRTRVVSRAEKSGEKFI